MQASIESISQSLDGVGEVTVHRLSSRVCVCLLNRLDDCLVFGNGILAKGRIVAEAIVQFGQEIGDGGHEDGEDGISGCPSEFPVEGLVVGDVFGAVADGSPHSFEFVGEDLEVFVASVLCGQGRDIGFECESCFEQVSLAHGGLNFEQRREHAEDGGRVELPYEEPFAVTGLDDAEAFEYGEGFPDREAAGAEHVNERAFGGESIPGLEAIVGDVLDEGAYDGVDDGFARRDG